MEDFEKKNWNDRWQAQLDLEVEHLLNLLRAKEDLDEQIAAQNALINLISSLIAPPE